MLVIRSKQMDAFRPLLRQRFEDELTEIVALNYPASLRQAGGRAQIGKLVALGVQRAGARAYVTKRQVSVYVSLMLVLGAEFAADPQLPWVAAYLDQQAIADPTMRIEQLFAAAMDYLGATAGEDGEHLAAALARMASFKLGSVPGRSGEAWISDIAAILNAFYPEKFQHQGEPAMRKLIWIGTRRAKARGLDERLGAFLYVMLMFMLGSGFEHDPLYPWTAALLADAADSARADAVFAEALACMDPT